MTCFQKSSVLKMFCLLILGSQKVKGNCREKEKGSLLTVGGCVQLILASYTALQIPPERWSGHSIYCAYLYKVIFFTMIHFIKVKGDLGKSQYWIMIKIYQLLHSYIRLCITNDAICVHIWKAVSTFNNFPESSWVLSAVCFQTRQSLIVLI